MPDLAGGQVSTDLTTLVDLSQVAALQNVKSTLNDLFETITKNITAKTLIFEDALALRSVSAVSTGKLDYNATAQSFQVSENGGAYQNLLKGSGTATRVAFWSAADELSSDAALYWQNTDKRLGIGVGTTPDAPLDILADGAALAQQWRPNAGTMRGVVVLDSSPEMFLGTSTAHTFHLITTNLPRLTVESGGRVGINKAAVVQAQLQIVSQDDSTETLILNTAPTPLVNIAEFYNDSSLRFAFTPAANLGIGLSGAGGATGSITLNGVTSGAVTVNVAAAAGTWTLTLPTTDGSANQFLQTDGNGVTTWATAITGAAPPAAAVQFNDGSNGFAGDPDFLWDTATGTLQLGIALSRTGKLQLRSIVSGSVTHTVGTPSAAHVLAWPDALPTALQVLTAGAVVGNDVTLSWTTPSAGATINPTNFVMPVRQDATTFIDSSLTITATTLALSQATAARTSGSPTFYNRILTPADTTLTASAESVGIQHGGNTSAATVTRQWATGALTTQREFLFVAPTYAFVGASTITNAGTLVVTSAPIAGTNATITNSFAVWAQAGVVRIDAAGTAAFPALQIFTDKRGFFATTGALAIADSSGTITAGLGISQASITGQLSVPSGGAFAFSSTTSAIGASDAMLVRHGVSVIRTTNGASGIGSILIGTSTDTLTGNFTVMSSNAATATIVTVARLGVNSTGTAADGFGAALSWSAETSTTNDTETGRINVFWTTATHASRTSAISFSLTNNATLAEVARLGTPSNNVGSPFVLTVHDGTNPNVWTAGAFAAKLYLISPTLPAVGVAAHFSATALDAPQWQMLRGRGTNASPTAIQSADSLGNIEWWGQTSTSTNNIVAGARIRVSATENWSAGNNGCDMIFFVSNNAGTITERMSLVRTGTLRIGATSGSVSTDTKLQIGNYASWNTDAVAAIYTDADDNKGLEIIGTNGQTANLFRVFLDAGADLFNILASGAFVGRVFTVATLPSAATAGAGARAFVSDALTPVILTTVTGGGAVDVPVYSDGANWLVG